MKAKETLEEAAEKFRNKNPGTMHGGNNTKILKSFISGAKWQAERMYSEEEVLPFGKSCFYKGFEKAEKDDANCYTAFREEIVSLIGQSKKKS